MYRTPWIVATPLVARNKRGDKTYRNDRVVHLEGDADAEEDDEWVHSIVDKMLVTCTPRLP